MKERYSHYILELLVVIAGVFIGMLVSDWNASRHLDERRDAFLRSIQSEMTENLRLLEGYEKRRKAFYLTLDSLSHVPQKERQKKFRAKSFNSRFPNWTGLGRSQFRDAMFDASKNSDVFTNLEVAVLEKLALVYNFQENTERVYEQYSQNFFKLIHDPNVTYGDMITLMWGVREELFGSQIYLANFYRDALKELEKELAK